MLELNDEFGEALGRSVLPTDIDETDLDAELEALGADTDFEGYLDADTAPSVPSSVIGGSTVVPNAPAATTNVSKGYDALFIQATTPETDQPAPLYDDNP